MSTDRLELMKSMQNLSDAIGMPDVEDKKVLRRLIMRYEKKYPGYIKNTIEEAKRDFLAQGGRKQKFGEVNSQAHGRIIFELPEELHKWIDDYLPTIFTDKKHFHWFVKNFKELLIPEKY